MRRILMRDKINEELIIIKGNFARNEIIDFTPETKNQKNKSLTQKER